MNKLVVICGPTGTGKTALAIRISTRLNGEVVSADSRQIYRGMDIGTGKIPVNVNVAVKKGEGYWIIDDVHIHLYDLVDPDHDFSVVRFSDAARSEIESMWRRNKIPFLVGGTGFYIAAVLNEVAIPRVPPDWKLRRELEKLPVDLLFQKLESLDPSRAKKIDPKNPRRLIRAIEIYLSSDSSLDQEPKDLVAKSDVVKIGLTASNEILFARADTWVENIINVGLVDEVRSLIDSGYKNSPPMQGIIYQTVIDFLENKISEDKMRQQIKFDLHGYIRRQLTWFKKDDDINWFDITDPNFDQRVEKLVESYLINGKND